MKKQSRSLVFTVVLLSVSTHAADLENSLTAFSDFIGMDRFPEQEATIAVPQTRTFSISNQWCVSLGIAATNDFREVVEVPFIVMPVGETNQIRGRIDWYPTRNAAITGVFLDRFMTPVPRPMELERVEVVTNESAFCICLEGDGLGGETPMPSHFRRSFMVSHNMIIDIDDSFKEETTAFLLGFEMELSAQAISAND